MPPTDGFFVTGTDTEVGKTVVSAVLAYGLQKRGCDVGVMKPVATGAHRRDGEFVADDTLILHKAVGGAQPISEITASSCTFEMPASPHLAAEMENRPIQKELVRASFESLTKKHACMIVEGVGGLFVPIRKDWMVFDMAQEFGLPLVVVARSGLGTLNHTLLTVDAARTRGLTIAGIVFNRTVAGENGSQSSWTPIERDNMVTIESLGSVKILGAIPYVPGLTTLEPASMYDRVEPYIDWNTIGRWLQ